MLDPFLLDFISDAKGNSPTIWDPYRKKPSHRTGSSPRDRSQLLVRAPFESRRAHRGAETRNDLWCKHGQAENDDGRRLMFQPLLEDALVFYRSDTKTEETSHTIPPQVYWATEYFAPASCRRFR